MSYFVYLVLRYIEISDMNLYHLRVDDESSKHTLSYSILIHPVRPCPELGAVKHAVSVRALKSTITEDLD